MQSDAEHAHRPTAPGLDLVVGLSTDGGAWPEHGGEHESGALGAPVVGIHGLLDHLETALGLGGPPSPAIERIAAWQSRLEAACDGTRFWSQALATDAWATARHLLGWRDRLVDAGWDARTTYEQPRLRDLAAAERAPGHLPPGLSDRLRDAADAIASEGRTGVHRLRLIDLRAHFPSGMRRLLDALELEGVAVEQFARSPTAPAAGALGRLQRWLLGSGDIGGESDDSLVIAHADGTLLAAEVVAQTLAALPGSDVVLVAQGGDTHALDAALALAGQPRAGLSAASPHRGALQVLLLAMQTAWAPLDVQALLDLVLAAPGPIPAAVGRRLAHALERAPSVHHPGWQEAWTAIERRAIEDAASEPDRRAARARVARWQAWLQPAGADPDAGIAVADAQAILDRVAQWATVRFDLDADPLYAATARVAGDARRALGRLQRERLPRPLLERVIDQALHQGEVDSRVEPEAAAHAPAAHAPAARMALAHPGAVWGPVDTVIWWDLRDTGERADRAPWTAAERAELARLGATVDADAHSAAALAAAWERAVLHARRQLVLIDTHAAVPDGARHPLAHRLQAVSQRLASHVDLGAAARRPTLDLGALRLPRHALALRPEPPVAPVWRTPRDFSARAAARGESPTSLERLVECHLQWALHDVAGLRRGRTRAIPDIHRLTGNLAHELARVVFPPGRPPAPADAERRARAALDTAIDEHAAPLRQREHTAALARVRRHLPRALGALARMLTHDRLKVLGSEREVAFTPAAGPPVRGFVDLLARTPDGAPVILDLKWTFGRHHRDDLERGRAVQLAAYVAAVRSGGGLDHPPPPGARVRAAYVRLLQHEIVSLRDDALHGAAVDGPPLVDTWEATLGQWRAWSRHAGQAGLVATGVEGAAEHWPEGLAPLREPRCSWCAFAGLCRIGEAP